MHRRITDTNACLGVAVAAALASGYASIALAASDPLASKFCLIAVPDPQYYSVVQWKTNNYYNTQMNWIASQASVKNVRFAFGLGDNVQDGNPYDAAGTFSGNITPHGMTGWVNGAPSIDTVDPVNGNFRAEWERASSAWNILHQANIPYYTVPGNHDYYHWDNKKLPTEFLSYFGPQRYQGTSWFGGYSPANTSTNTNVRPYAGLNAYSYFYAGGYKFLNLALQDVPDSGDLAWAQSVIDANKGLPTILTTHEYQDTNGRNAVGNNIWNGLVNKTGNSQIFMVLSGHINGVHQQTSLDAEGKPVLEMLSDFQDMHFDLTNGYNQNYANGGGFLRTLDFDTAANTIHVQTFSPYIQSQGGPGYLTTGAGSFANDFTLNFDFDERFGPPPFVTGKTFYWDPTHTGGQSGGGSGVWDTSATNWYGGGSGNVAWTNTVVDDAALGGTAGTINVGAAGVMVNSINFTTSGYTLAGGTLTVAGSAPAISVPAGGTVTLSNVVAGTAGLTVKGGTVTLNAANTFSGGLNVGTNGTVRFTADNNLGAAGQGVALDGGKLSYSGTVPVSGLNFFRTLSFGANGGTIDIATAPVGDGKLIINGTNKITGSGPITKTGTGWLTIYGGGNNATGRWTINGGVVEVGTASGLGSGTVTVNNGAELANNASGGIPNPLILNSGATIGADYYQQTATGTFSGDISANGAFNVRLGNFYPGGYSQRVVLSGDISGVGTLSVVGPVGSNVLNAPQQQLTLSGNNANFSGGIVIPTGTVVAPLSANNTLGTGRITLAGGKLALQGQIVGGNTSASQTYVNSVTVGADSGIDISNSLNATVQALNFSAGKLAVTSSAATANGYTLSFAATVISGNGTIDVANGAGGGPGGVVFGAMSGTGSLTKSGPGTLRLSAGGSIGGLSIIGGKVDLIDNDLLVASATSRATIEGYIRSARNSGSWDGPGLTSSAAAAQASHSTTLGVLSGAEFKAVNGPTFNGQSVGDADTLVKYTYYGDTDFNGRVNFDDYVRADNGFNNHLTGWLNGDFDGNGAVNFDDYVLIDLAFNTQSGTLGRTLAYLEGSDRRIESMREPALRQVQQHLQQFGQAYAQGLIAAVPEPGSVATLVALASSLVLPRRQRRRN